MPKLLKTKMIQHSYTVGLCKNKRGKAQFQTKGSMLIFYNFGVILHVRLFLPASCGTRQMLVETLGSVEPQMKITGLCSKSSNSEGQCLWCCHHCTATTI